MILLFLAVLFVLFVVETVLTETENFSWATVTLLMSFGFFAVGGHYHWFGLPSLFDFVKDHGIWTLAYVCAYLLVGVGWSFAKWFSYLMSFRDTFREQKDAFIKSRGLNPEIGVPPNLQDEFRKFVSDNVGWTNPHRSQLALLERPRATKNKARITAWASFWPFSFVGTLLNDPVRRLVNFLFNQFKALYQRMSDWIFRKDMELQ